MIRKSFISTLAVAGLISIATGNARAVAETDLGLFGTIEIASDDLTSLPQWKRVISSFKELDKQAALCDRDIQKCKSQQMTLWRAKIQELELETANAKVRQINSFINKWRMATDEETYKRSDHWAEPLEFIVNGGDSEDFAIMKYISLKELGIPASSMRIVVTNDVLRGKTHTILSVDTGSERYVLDSQNNTILREDLVRYYVPFYSLNETKRWAHVPKQAADLKKAAGVEKND
jgi:predicted transglutaminase-like cysteine proteinase